MFRSSVNTVLVCSEVNSTLLITTELTDQNARKALLSLRFIEALLGVLGILGIRDIWIENYRDMSYVYKRLGDIEHNGWRCKPLELTG